MRRRDFIAGLMLLAAPARALAQQAGKAYRIGVLSPEALPPGLLETLQDGLRDLGYVEGQNLAFEVRGAAGKPERLFALANELVRDKVNLIVAVNSSAALAAKRATTAIPIVILRVADPVESGLVSSLAHPGGNITGLSVMLEDYIQKPLELLKQALPGLSRVAVLWNPDNPGATIVANAMERASSRLGLELLRLPVHGASDLAGAFLAAVQARAEALDVVEDAVIASHRAEILDLAAKHALPVLATYKDLAEAGALISYGPSLLEMYRREAYYVDKILKGAKPGDLPIEQPTKFYLFVNLKTAKTLGLTIPQSILLRADEVIE